MASTQARISIGAAAAFARLAYRKHWRLLTSVLAAMLGAWILLELVVVATQRLGILAWVLTHIAFLFGFAGMEVGLLRISLALHDARNPSFADAFKRFDLAPRFLAGQLLYLVMVLAGLVLLVGPGIFLAARFSLFGFPCSAGQGGVLRSFELSADLSRGATSQLTAILVVLFAFNVLGAALLGVGLFVTIPISVLTMASIYRQLDGSVTTRATA